MLKILSKTGCIIVLLSFFALQCNAQIAMTLQRVSLGVHYNGWVNGAYTGSETTVSHTQGEKFSDVEHCRNKPISTTPQADCSGSVTGASGTTYNLVYINGQCWMAENLNEVPSNYSTYTTADWTNSSDQGYWGYYNTTTTNGSAGWGTSEPAAGEGLLYQWSAAMNGSITERAQGACPDGWHVPSDCEWMYLEHGLGMKADQLNLSAWRGNDDDTQGLVGKKLKSAGSLQNNASGFSALLAGSRSTTGAFHDRSSYGRWWSSSASGSSNAIRRTLDSVRRGVFRNAYHRAYGISVRCLKD